MVYLLICFFRTHSIYLTSFFSYFYLLKRLLKDNKYFGGIKHSLENWRVDMKVFLFINLFISLLKYIYFFLFHVFKLRSQIL